MFEPMPREFDDHFSVADEAIIQHPPINPLRPELIALVRGHPRTRDIAAAVDSLHLKAMLFPDSTRIVGHVMSVAVFSSTPKASPTLRVHPPLSFPTPLVRPCGGSPRTPELQDHGFLKSLPPGCMSASVRAECPDP